MGVSWYEVVAFCRWLDERLQVTGCRFQVLRNEQLETLDLKPETPAVRLPSEPEWEKAARGGMQIPNLKPQTPILVENPEPGRVFPWGSEPDAGRANYDATGIGTTSAVGCFPGGASPYGVEDLSGNVWEWCATKWEGSYADYKGDDGPEGDVRRVLRGGAFYDNERSVRCAYRDLNCPYARYRLCGFRLCVVSQQD